ncbi:hypothetical protein ACIP6P_32705 [Streptomyces sp. NPDC088729]|uniref:hypothetical protein n=1 Tax=Streptomyces sp. NPDC088729 TaxID=3365876 RepID=UPI00382E3634
MNPITEPRAEQIETQIWPVLVSAGESYRASTSLAYDEVLAEIAQRAERSGSLGKSDIGALVLWKRLSARTPWASALTSPFQLG